MQLNRDSHGLHHHIQTNTTNEITTTIKSCVRRNIAKSKRITWFHSVQNSPPVLHLTRELCISLWSIGLFKQFQIGIISASISKTRNHFPSACCSKLTRNLIFGASFVNIRKKYPGSDQNFKIYMTIRLLRPWIESIHARSSKGSNRSTLKLFCSNRFSTSAFQYPTTSHKFLDLYQLTSQLYHLLPLYQILDRSLSLPIALQRHSSKDSSF